MVMAAVEHPEAIAHTSPARRSAFLLVLLTLAAGYALTVLVFYPGYSTADARYVYADAMAWRFGDWQSPAMAVLWRLVDPLAPAHRACSCSPPPCTGWRSARSRSLRRDARSGSVSRRARRLHAAGIFFRRNGLARRPIRDHLAGGGGARLRGGRSYRTPARSHSSLRAVVDRLRRLLRPNAVVAAPFLAAYVAWPLRFELKRMAMVFLPRSSCSPRSSPLSITVFFTRSGKIPSTRSRSSISAASPTSLETISFRCHGARIRPRC